MCNGHSDTPAWVLVPAHLSYTERDRWDTKMIDGCIAKFVETLNAVGLHTVASCCGHGYRPGNIALADGREFLIAKDFDEARRVEAAFQRTSYGEDLINDFISDQ